MKDVVKLLSILLIASGVGFVSCGKDPVKVTGVTLDGEKALTIENGETITLKATVNPSDAEDKSVKWETSDDEVATVDNNGNVKAVGVGKATITVRTTDGGFTDQCKITVTPKIEDFYEILASCEHQHGGTWYSSGISLPVDNPYEGNVNFSAPFRATIKNMSGKIIPEGTPIKCQLVLNNNPFELPGANVPSTILVETTLKRDVGVGDTYSVIEADTYQINPTTHPIGDHTVCLVVSKIGKTDCTPIRGCATYTVKYK